MREYNDYLNIAARVLDRDNDWMDFKKIMLRTLPSSMRKNFSTRDPKTKKQSLNEFEVRMIDTYFKKTGVLLKLGENDD
jgi:hypothetical protein